MGLTQSHQSQQSCSVQAEASFSFLQICRADEALGTSTRKLLTLVALRQEFFFC